MGAIGRLHLWAVEQPILRVFTLTVRVLLAIAFVPSGLVKIMGEPFTTLPVSDPVGYFFAGFFSPRGYCGSMGSGRPTAHPSHGDARGRLVPAHHREHLRDHGRDWIVLCRYPSGHRGDVGRQHIPPVLGLGSVEAHPSPRSTRQRTTWRSDHGPGNDDRGRHRILGRHRDSPCTAASWKLRRPTDLGGRRCTAGPGDARQCISACKCTELATVEHTRIGVDEKIPMSRRSRRRRAAYPRTHASLARVQGDWQITWRRTISPAWPAPSPTSSRSAAPLRLPRSAARAR